MCPLAVSDFASICVIVLPAVISIREEDDDDDVVRNCGRHDDACDVREVSDNLTSFLYSFMQPGN